MSDLITQMEPEVRSSLQTFPTVFTSGQGSILENENGFRFIDFFAGAGTLNYGHNNPRVKQALLDYINGDGVQYSRGMATKAQIEFIREFENIILKPRELDYSVQFTGPTANSVEAAIMLARKARRRSNIIAFTNGHHGHGVSSRNLPRQRFARLDQYESCNNVTCLPFDGYLAGFDSCQLLDKMLSDPGSGLPTPAAVVMETIQCNGGINVASFEWLRRIAEICRQQEIPLIVDDCDVGNGRTGRFFSFEEAGIVPDMVCVSKSTGGGLPLPLVLIRRDSELRLLGEQTATFCGNRLALAAARALLDYWRTDALVGPSAVNQGMIEAALRRIASQYSSSKFDVRGRGMMWGIDVHDGDTANEIVNKSFEHGLLIETVGATGQVIKLSPALTIEPNELQVGLRILEKTFAAVLAPRRVNTAESDTCDFATDATTVSG